MPACVPPDTPPRLDTRLPAAVFELVQPDTVRTERIAPGVLYRYLWSPLGPWAVHLVESALDQRCDVVLDVLQAEPRETGGEGRELVTSMVERVGPAVLAAVNADFFTPEGRTVGAEVVDGRVTAARARPALAWKPGEPPWIGVPSVQGAWIDVGWPISIEGGDGQTQAVGGFPELLDQGEAGDNVGVLLRCTKREDVERGQVLAAPGSITPHTKFTAEAYILTKDEGGRHTPFFANYRPQFYFRTTDVTGTVVLPEGTEMVMPGDNLKFTVELIAPIAMEESLRFAIREGGRTVGSGVVSKILE